MLHHMILVALRKVRIANLELGDVFQKVYSDSKVGEHGPATIIDDFGD